MVFACRVRYLPVFHLVSRVPVTCIITTKDLGWWYKLFPFLLQTERSGRLAERFLTLASGASEQHLAMSSPFIRAVGAMQGSWGWRRSAVLPGGAIWSPHSREGGAPLQGDSRLGSLHSVRCSRCPTPRFSTRQSFKMALS